jgi:hypothetical protein
MSSNKNLLWIFRQQTMWLMASKNTATFYVKNSTAEAPHVLRENQPFCITVSAIMFQLW